MSLWINRVIRLAIISILLSCPFGCQSGERGDGLHVMFKSPPKIYQTEVYDRGHIIGSIKTTDTTRGGISMVTVRIAPEFEKYAGMHWAFYVDKGRLTAGKLNSTGTQLKTGDRICGFHSKSAFNWFKFKTLLNDRISHARRRAEKLHQHFAQSG